MERLYSSNDKSVNKALGNVVLVMLRNTSSHCNFVSKITQFNIFKGFLMKMNEGNVTQQKKMLLDLKFQLCRIASMPNIKSQYEALEEVVIESEVQEFIANLLNANYLDGI